MPSITSIISPNSCGTEKEAVLEHIFCVSSSTAQTVGCSSITKSAASVSYGNVLASESRSLSPSTGRIGIFTGKVGSTGNTSPEVGIGWFDEDDVDGPGTVESDLVSVFSC